MWRLIAVACVTLFLVPWGRPVDQQGTSSQHSRFAKYRAVEAYEFRSDILMLPSYSDDGQLCKIGLEKRHYYPDQFDFTSDLPEKQIDQIVDELVPVSERGRRREFDDVHQIGRMSEIVTDYENIIVRRAVDTPQMAECSNGNMVISVEWKNRRCHLEKN